MWRFYFLFKYLTLFFNYIIFIIFVLQTFVFEGYYSRSDFLIFVGHTIYLVVVPGAASFPVLYIDRNAQHNNNNDDNNKFIRNIFLFSAANVHLFIAQWIFYGYDHLRFFLILRSRKNFIILLFFRPHLHWFNGALLIMSFLDMLYYTCFWSLLYHQTISFACRPKETRIVHHSHQRRRSWFVSQTHTHTPHNTEVLVLWVLSRFFLWAPHCVWVHFFIYLLINFFSLCRLLSLFISLAPLKWNPRTLYYRSLSCVDATEKWDDVSFVRSIELNERCLITLWYWSRRFVKPYHSAYDSPIQ